MEGQYLSRHVEKELRDFLKCGVLAHGFVRMRCNECGRSMVVGFSCKGRGFCPSCTGRRMADTSLRLVRNTRQLILQSKMSERETG
ncbi:MAG: transposase zinc-binding domain-containing protein [Deltaproteobacteria bacterium]|nr:transposase zinc-binding domain-containing protein [Deltaproteobacteria bacterium]